jgi:hypothetical protein
VVNGSGPTSPASLEPEDYDRLLDQTRERLAQLAPGAPLGAALHAVDLRLFNRWADDYRRQHADYDRKWQDCEAPLRPTWFEESFGPTHRESGERSSDRPLKLGTGDAVIRIAGRIDRIDTGTVAGRPVFNVLDYKTGSADRYRRSGLAGGTALQLPLYAMAAEDLLLADEGAVPWQVGYWFLQERGFKPAQKPMYACEGDRLEPTDEWRALRPAVVAMVEELVAEIRGGRFRVASADEHCTRFCPFHTVCRIGQVRSLEKTWHPTSHEG